MCPANIPVGTEINNIDYTINGDRCETDRWMWKPFWEQAVTTRKQSIQAEVL